MLGCVAFAFGVTDRCFRGLAACALRCLTVCARWCPRRPPARFPTRRWDPGTTADGEDVDSVEPLSIAAEMPYATPETAQSASTSRTALRALG
jgi:hypothetical protein